MDNKYAGGRGRGGGEGGRGCGSVRGSGERGGGVDEDGGRDGDGCVMARGRSLNYPGTRRVYPDGSYPFDGQSPS